MTCQACEAGILIATHDPECIYTELRRDNDRRLATASPKSCPHRGTYPCTLLEGHRGPHRLISTRRKHPRTGVVHEMAPLGVRTACGIDLPEPWEWTDEPLTCKSCRYVLSPAGQRP